MNKMNKENRLHLRIAIKKFLDQQPDLTDNEVFHLMKKLGYPTRTIYRWIKRIREGGELEDKPRTSRPRCILSPKKAKVRRRLNNKLGLGTRQVALMEEISQSSVVRIMKEGGIIYRKRRRAPKYTDKQLEDILTKA